MLLVMGSLLGITLLVGVAGLADATSGTRAVLPLTALLSAALLPGLIRQPTAVLAKAQRQVEVAR